MAEEWRKYIDQVRSELDGKIQQTESSLIQRDDSYYKDITGSTEKSLKIRDDNIRKAFDEISKLKNEVAALKKK